MRHILRIASLTTILLIVLTVIFHDLPVLKAESSILKWTLMHTPGFQPDKNDIITPCEVNHLSIGTDGKTFYALDTANANITDGDHALYKSTDAGYSWDDTPGKSLFAAMTPTERANFCVWNMAVASNNVNMVALVTNSDVSAQPANLWISSDGGNSWYNTNAPVTSNISQLDITSFNSDYYIAIGTRSGTGSGNIYILKHAMILTWTQQNFSGDIISLKYSPNYKDDQSLSVVYSDSSGSYLNTAIHDPISNTTQWEVIYSNPVEITTKGTGSSAKVNQIISADIELPSDFNGQASSLRRYYVSVDSLSNNSGIFRIDDTVPYWIMQANTAKRISSIAYLGTYSSGKLLAGEVLGDPCAASVMTWFTDAPVTCPGTCWYQAKKPPTGAAGKNDCAGSGFGNAQVCWSADGEKAYCGTASTDILVPGIDWADPYMSGQDLDESAFSISQNNGASWNQLSLIDTQVDRFIEISSAADCSNLYLASINTSENCSGYDSVWRSVDTQHKNWERVLCKACTDQSCAKEQTDGVVLALSEDKKDGQILFWAAQNSRLVMWSADYGDFWFTIPCQLRIQDMITEDSNTLYILENTGMVQKFEYKAGGWASTSLTMSGLDKAYSIASAYTANTLDNAKHVIMVGGQAGSNYSVAYSENAAKTFYTIPKRLPTDGHTVVMASSSFNSDGTILAINSGGMYAWSIYGGQQQEWETWWGGIAWPSPVTGMAISRNYSMYLTTPSSLWAPATPYVRWASALAELDPTISLGTPEEPGRHIRICGGLVTGENITVYLIDQRDYAPPQGGIWYYEDSLVWEGPLPTSPISMNTVKYDPVSGRASEINFNWKPVSLSKGYRIQLAKDPEFNLLLADIGDDWMGPFYTPANPDNPALVIPPGGGKVVDNNGNIWLIPSLESGHSYYWRVRVQDVYTGDNIQSPWSWRESFIVKQGLPVESPNLGPQLLQPAPACDWSINSQVCFSWTPMHETEQYRFELSQNPNMSSPLSAVEVETTAFKTDKLIQGTYYWRVRAIKPHASEWSPVGIFYIRGE